MNKIIDVLKEIKLNMKYYYLKNMKPNKYPQFIKKEYKKRTNEVLDLENPKKYTEKIQYSKLYLNSTFKTKLTDKYLVRDWVEEKIGSEYLIPLLGVWDNYSDISFKKLPNKFVLKTNHGSGWNLIVHNKNEINHKKQQEIFDEWLAKNYAYDSNLQLHYKDIKPKIIAEKFVQDSNDQLNDYKFFCFDGEVYYCWFFVEDENERYGNIYDLDWNLQNWRFEDRKNSPYKIKKPQKFKKMIEIAAILSEGLSHVRVDLYNVDGEIYFGEMTFTSSGGYHLITPEEYNYKLGDLWGLPNNTNNT